MTHAPSSNAVLVLVLALLLPFAVACDQGVLAPPDAPAFQENDGDGSSLKASAPQSSNRSTVPVLTFATVEDVGTSQLDRTDNGVSFRLTTTGLEPGTVHTLWMVLFNHPENCSPPACGTDDLTNLDAAPDLTYSAGAIIGDAGRATFAGHRHVGDNSGSIMQEWLELPEPGLLRPRGAEIHFVVHSHGPKIPGLVNEMLHSFNAGCGPVFDPAFPEVPESLGTYGPNTCSDVQFAVHAP